MYLLRKINSLCKEADDTKHTIIKACFASEIEHLFLKSKVDRNTFEEKRNKTEYAAE